MWAPSKEGHILGLLWAFAHVRGDMCAMRYLLTAYCKVFAVFQFGEEEGALTRAATKRVVLQSTAR